MLNFQFELYFEAFYALKSNISMLLLKNFQLVEYLKSSTISDPFDIFAIKAEEEAKLKVKYNHFFSCNFDLVKNTSILTKSLEKFIIELSD